MAGRARGEGDGGPAPQPWRRSWGGRYRFGGESPEARLSATSAATNGKSVSARSLPARRWPGSGRGARPARWHGARAHGRAGRRWGRGVCAESACAVPQRVLNEETSVYFSLRLLKPSSGCKVCHFPPPCPFIQSPGSYLYLGIFRCVTPGVILFLFSFFFSSPLSFLFLFLFASLW